MTDETEELPYTVPDRLSVTVGGLNGEKGSEFGRLIINHLYGLSTWIDLSRLDAVTIADAYVEALANVDRGFEGASVMTRSENENIVGVAMSVQVMRDGTPKAHLVADINALLPLYILPDSHPEYRQALHLLAHECAHIEDLRQCDDDYPGVILRKKELDGWTAVTFMSLAEVVWQEYYACRRTAPLCPEAAEAFAATFASSIDTTRLTVDDAIRRYRWHGDLDQLLIETLEPAGRPLKLAAYLLGHLDGLGQGLDSLPEIYARLTGDPFAEPINMMHSELRRLWDHGERWRWPEEFAQLVAIARDGYAAAGIIATDTLGGGANLHVPFTADTT